MKSSSIYHHLPVNQIQIVKDSDFHFVTKTYVSRMICIYKIIKIYEKKIDVVLNIIYVSIHQGFIQFIISLYKEICFLDRSHLIAGLRKHRLYGCFSNFSKKNENSSFHCRTTFPHPCRSSQQ